MVYLQLAAIFVVLVALVIVVFWILAFLLPILVWLIGIGVVVALVVSFGVMIYQELTS
ncbi:hypothetical protein [Helicobacter aurati]|uniref:hypothetical protein n=1 Tax=Helicobacter aurati TaxID=137778 RepID=UPI0015F1BECD|nr:hypothetical protein [Helicobacter aurati]